MEARLAVESSPEYSFANVALGEVFPQFAIAQFPDELIKLKKCWIVMPAGLQRRNVISVQTYEARRNQCVAIAGRRFSKTEVRFQTREISRSLTAQSSARPPNRNLRKGCRHYWLLNFEARMSCIIYIYLYLRSFVGTRKRHEGDKHMA